MRSALKYLFVLVAVLSPFGGYDAVASVCGPDGRAIVEKELQSALIPHPDLPLFLTRREDLESEIYDLQHFQRRGKRTADRSVVCVQVFDVRDHSIRVEDGKVITSAISVHGSWPWRVAFEPDSKKVFHLYGFSDDADGFSSLMRTLGLEVATEDSALAVQFAYLCLSYHERDEVDVRSEFGAMEALARNQTEHISVKKFYAKWNRCPAKIRHQIENVKFLETSNGFTSTFFTVLDQRLCKTTISIQRDGGIADIKETTLFDWAK